MSTGLVVMETTNDVFNGSLYDLVVPQSLLSWTRAVTANTIARTGPAWGDMFGWYNRCEFVVCVSVCEDNREFVIVFVGVRMLYGCTRCVVVCLSVCLFVCMCVCCFCVWVGACACACVLLLQRHVLQHVDCGGLQPFREGDSPPLQRAHHRRAAPWCVCVLNVRMCVCVSLRECALVCFVCICMCVCVSVTPRRHRGSERHDLSAELWVLPLIQSPV